MDWEVELKYDEFVTSKCQRYVPTGLTSDADLGYRRPLFPFQEAVVRWMLRRGRAAGFASTGLGKTSMQVAYADQVHRATGRDVLVLSPLAVAQQTVREGAEMGIDLRYARSQADVRRGITITNYDMLQHFDPSAFGAVVLDESSILKNETGATRNAIVSAFAGTPFRAEFSATPAPNDYMELGNHAQFLGVMNLSEMLATYFVHDGGSTSDWRLKGHAEAEFWRWVASWAALVTRPSDLGFNDDGYDLPELVTREHIIETGSAPSHGMLFAEQAKTLAEQRDAKRRTLRHRCEKVAELVAAEPNEPWIVWCDLNDEGNLLEDLIPGAVQIAGSDKREVKEERMLAFASGEIRVLVTKPKIAGFGLNWQHCARVAFAGPTHKWEEYYQAVRRCWRFGQTRPVHVHLVSSDIEGRVLESLKRKEADAARLAESLRALVSSEVMANVTGLRRVRDDVRHTKPATIPPWLAKRRGDWWPGGAAVRTVFPPLEGTAANDTELRRFT